MKELRHHIRLLFCLCIGMIFSCAQIWGQDESNSFVDEMHLLEIESRMLSFYQELKDISARVGQYTSNEQLTEASQKVTTIDAKWNTYYQSRQIEIAEDDSLLQIVADYQLTKQNLLDSIAIQNTSSMHKKFRRCRSLFSDTRQYLCQTL